MKSVKMRRSLTTVVAAVSALCVLTAAAAEVNAADSVYTLTLLDFDGEVMGEITAAEGEIIDLSSIDTSSLNGNIDVNTERRFYAWNETPETLTEDMTIQALYRQMSISLDSTPTRVEYYDNFGDVRLDGLTVTIRVITQLPERDENGEYATEEQLLDITAGCTASPSTLEEAFAENDTSMVNVYPPSSEKPILSYRIGYYRYLGDADMDGIVSAADASYILKLYSDYATGKQITFEAGQKKRCDVDGNGLIEATDASLVLQFYADAATSPNPSWDAVLNLQ